MESKKIKLINALTFLSENKNFTESIEEWTVVNITEDESITCLCGKSNANHTYYKLMNKINKNEIYLAFDCISKYIPEMKHFATVLCKQSTYLKKGKTNKRMCHGCLKHNLSEEKPAWQTTCPTCYSSGIKAPIIPILNYRICKVCCIPNIDPSKLDYVDKCTACFKLMKENVVCRECSLCKELKIPANKPDYVDKCDSCYKDLQNTIEKRQCKRCEKFNIPSTSPKYVDKCMPCFKLSKEEEKTGPMRNCVLCDQHNIPASKPKYVTKCEECFKMSKNENKIYVDEIPDISFEMDNFTRLTAMMNIK